MLFMQPVTSRAKINWMPNKLLPNKSRTQTINLHFNVPPRFSCSHGTRFSFRFSFSFWLNIPCGKLIKLTRQSIKINFRWKLLVRYFFSYGISIYRWQSFSSFFFCSHAPCTVWAKLFPRTSTMKDDLAFDGRLNVDQGWKCLTSSLISSSWSIKQRRHMRKLVLPIQGNSPKFNLYR